MVSIIDASAISAHFQGDEDILAALLQSYLLHEADLTSSLRVAVASRDLKSIVTSAHRLRGTVSQFFVNILEQSLNRLEVMARNEASDGLYKEISREMERTNLYLQQLHDDLLELNKGVTVEGDDDAK